MNLNDEILDTAITEKPNKGKVQFKAFVVLIILWGGLVWKARHGLAIDANNSIIIVLLFCATILTFFNQKLGVKMTFLILLLGVFRGLTFFSTFYSIGFGIASARLWIEVYLLVIFCIHLLLFPDAFSSMKRELISSIAGDKIQHDNEKRANRFIIPFSDKSPNALSKILSNENMSDEARAAAAYLLKKVEDRIDSE